MKAIIVKKPDQGVVLMFPNHEKFGEGKIDYAEYPPLSNYRGLEWFLVDHVECAIIRRHPSRESRSQLYHDGNTLKIDLGWDIRLMPAQIIRKKNIKRCNDAIDRELEKENPDNIEIIRIIREREKCFKWTEQQCYEQAKKIIEEEKINKPIILEKLNAKIAELENRKN